VGEAQADAITNGVKALVQFVDGINHIEEGGNNRVVDK
jgi:hypothetical protein